MTERALVAIISGGQTGADQGGLLAAHDLGVMTGGIAPANYLTSTGHNPLLETLNLTAAGTYATRTVENVRAADATVIIVHNMSSPGTRLTSRACQEAKKPLLLLSVHDIVMSITTETLQLDAMSAQLEPLAQQLADFIVSNSVEVLNVAGNRELTGKLTMTAVTRALVRRALQLVCLNPNFTVLTTK